MPQVTPDLNSVQSPSQSLAPMSAFAPLQLQIIGTQRHGHVVEIASARCTIGSAADCTVRLRAPGVRPIHCVILRGLDGMVVRCLSADTFLNGRVFREQSLRAGDRLRLGPIEFDVLGESTIPISKPEESQPARPPATPAPPEVPIWTGAETDRPSEILTQPQRLEQPLFGSPDADERDVDTDPVPKTLEPASSNLVESVLATEPTDAITQESSTPSTPSVLEQTLLARTEEFNALRQKLDERTAQWEEIRHKLQSELDALRSECERQQREIADRGEAFNSELAQLTAELQNERRNLESARQAWSTDCDQLENQRRSLSQLHTDVEQRSHADQIKFDMDRENWLTERLGLEQLLEDFRYRNEELEQEAKLLTEQYHRIAGKLEELEARVSAPSRGINAHAGTVSGLADAGTVSGLLVPDPTHRQSQLWLAGAAHPPQDRSELAWMAQQFAATLNTNTEEEIADASDAASYSSDTASYPSDAAGCASDEASYEVDAASYPSDAAGYASDEASYEVDAASYQADASTYDADASTFDAEESRPIHELDSSMNRNESSWANEHETAATDKFDSAAEPTSEPSLSPPQFSVRFHSNRQKPPELDESVPLYQPPHVETELTSTVEFPIADEGSPAANDDPNVFDRLQRAGIWRERTDDSDGSSLPVDLATADSISDQRVDAPRDLAIESTVRESIPSPTASVEVEDSIESYMQRLLERMRGSDDTGAAPPTYVFPVEERSPVTEMEAIAGPEAAESAEPSSMEEKDYIPRSHAPESNVNLSAMRELANDSRQQNILSHDHRTWSAESAGKLLSAFAGFTVAFASYFLKDIHPRFAAVGFMGGIGTGLVCLWQALSLRRRLFDSLRLDIVRPPSDESSAAAEVPSVEAPREDAPVNES